MGMYRSTYLIKLMSDEHKVFSQIRRVFITCSFLNASKWVGTLVLE